MGAIQCFFGYFFMWVSVAGIIPKPNLGFMCLFMFLGAHAQTFFNTANVVTAVHNFPGYSGTIVGIMKGFLGLSGAILIQVYLMLFRGNPGTFLLILAVMPSLLSILLMFVVRINPTYGRDDQKSLNRLSAFSLLLAAWLMFSIILENLIEPPMWSSISTLVLLIFFLSAPFGIAINAPGDSSLGVAHTSSTVSPLIDNSQRVEQKSKFSEATCSHDYVPTNAETGQKEASPEDGSRHREEIEINLFQAFRTINFWLLFVAMLCGMGSGLATVNNISQIGESLGYSAGERSTMVSLWSIWNFLGRFGAGYVSDLFLRRKGWARPLFVALMLAVMTAGHVIIASGFPGNLYVGSVLVGICYGSQWSLMPTITSEIFGVLHMGTIFNTIAIASPIGSYLLSIRVIGYIYDANVSGPGNTCYGKHCFMLSFYILASVSLFGFFVAMVLFVRTQRFYSQIVKKLMRRTEID